MYLHNNIPTYNKKFNNLILKYDWDFFITLTYDTNRKINPLVQTEDAVFIDNSYLSIQDQKKLIENLITKRML